MTSYHALLALAFMIFTVSAQNIGFMNQKCEAIKDGAVPAVTVLGLAAFPCGQPTNMTYTILEGILSLEIDDSSGRSIIGAIWSSNGIGPSTFLPLNICVDIPQTGGFFLDNMC